MSSPEGVKNALGTVFQSNTLVRSLTVLEYFTNVTVLVSGALYPVSNLLYLVFPPNVRNIQWNSIRYCQKLVYIKILSDMLVELNGSNGMAYTNNCPIYVADDLVDSYKSHQYWKQYASRFKPMSTFPY